MRATTELKLHRSAPVVDRALAVLRTAVAEQVFPGAAIAVTYQGELVALEGVGHFSYDPASPAVSADTVFDLASLTKVVATTTMAMILYERGELDLDLPLVAVVPEFCQTHRLELTAERSTDPGAKRIDADQLETGNTNLPITNPSVSRWLGGDYDPGRREVTFRMLLAHTSGLPAYERLFEQARTRDAMWRAVCSVPLASPPDTQAVYSDLGFILLGEALARISGESLDSFCRREIFGPLGMANTTFCPPPEWRRRIPPTQDQSSFHRRIIQGEVQDENACALGGIAGHAGLFAPAGDLARFAECMLRGGAPILRPQTIALFTFRQRSPLHTSRALGWDTPSQPSQSGRYFSARSFGHLGYTGTSLWIDPERQLSITLLTNRTWPNPTSQKIKKVRPRFHNAVVEALASQSASARLIQRSESNARHARDEQD